MYLILILIVCLLWWGCTVHTKGSIKREQHDLTGNLRCGGYDKEQAVLCPSCFPDGRPYGEARKTCIICGGYGEIPKLKKEK